MNGQCEKMERLIIDYVLGELTRSDVEVVEKHVSSCPQCSEALGSIQQMCSALSQHELIQPSEAASESIRKAVRERVFARRSAVSTMADAAASFVRRPILAGASALVVVAAVALLVVLDGSRAPEQGPGARPPIEISITVLRGFADYLSESNELMRLTLGSDADNVLSSYRQDDWKRMVGQAMYMQEIEGLQVHQPLLQDLERFYRKIMDCQGGFGEEEIRGIRQLISEANLIERAQQAVRSRE